MEPPSFQEAPRCDVCKCSFNAFRRRQAIDVSEMGVCDVEQVGLENLELKILFLEELFGVFDVVQLMILCSIIADPVGGHCATNIHQAKWLYLSLAFTHRSAIGDVQASSDGTDYITASVSTLDIGGDADPKTKPTMQSQPASAVLECKCRMPLCICEAPAPSVDAAPIQIKTTSTPLPQSPKAKKTETVVKSKPSTSNSKHGSVFNLGQANNGISEKKIDYEVNGEGMREAIKNGDIDAVKKLLSEGVNSNYHDRQGLSLLHLAAVFNQTEIVFALMDSGASLDYKNAQGETPLDCAPVTLQYKMREKMEQDKGV
ncbi:hypothetical protein ACLB2K_000829 [Fragaria x ananassa]